MVTGVTLKVGSWGRRPVQNERRSSVEVMGVRNGAVKKRFWTV